MFVRIADFDTDYSSIHRVRTAVFIDEQHVPPELEFDEHDPDPACTHVLAFDGDTPIATGRIDVSQGGKVGRVAVLAPYRRSGIGTALMQRLHAVAREHGLRGVWCNAQTAAEAFYRRLGYRATGDLFFEAGIEHIRMEHDF